MGHNGSMGDFSEGPRDPRELRVGFHERDAVIEILRMAAGEGRITADELDERIELASRARTYADLDPIVADLPVPPPSLSAPGTAPWQRGTTAPDPGGPPAERPGATGPRPRRPMEAGAAPGYDPGDPLVINARWDSESRTANWATVPYILLKPTAAKLDFTQARNSLGEISVDIEGATRCSRRPTPS